MVGNDDRKGKDLVSKSHVSHGGTTLHMFHGENEVEASCEYLLTGIPINDPSKFEGERDISLEEGEVALSISEQQINQLIHHYEMHCSRKRHVDQRRAEGDPHYHVTQPHR